MQAEEIYTSTVLKILSMNEIIILIMMKVRKTRIIIILLFLCLTNVVLGQIQTVRDTIFCFSKDVIIEYPLFNKITVDNYEEGFFRIINCPLDSAAIVIHCGAMVNLPLTDTTKVTISSKFILDKDLRILKGYDR